MSSSDDGRSIKGLGMSAVGDVQAANTLLGRLERIEISRRGISMGEARTSIAGKLRTSPGTLENVRRFRIKTIPSWLMERIRAELVAALKHEIARCEHEIHIQLQIGARPDQDDLVAAQAQVAAVKLLLGSNS